MNAGIDSRRGFTVVTSRCRLELIHKAVRARLGTLVSLFAPTALTVQWAIKHRLNQTGVELEALTAVSVAALTLYDMCKAVDRGMVIAN